MKIPYPNYIDNLIRKFYDNKFKAYIVGGSIRNILLGITPNDWDICTNALPNEIIEIFSESYKIIPIGIEHGTVTILVDGESIEVTTFRLDSEYSDGRRPNRVEFIGDIKGDLSRRDFTVNALAYNHKEGLIDYFNGVQDIKNKIIKTVGDPLKRFDEDYLRMLRCIRFSTQLGFEIEDSTYNGILKIAEKIVNISPERIREELNKILLSSNPVKGISLLESAGLLKYIIPELDECVGFLQYNPNHDKDVFGHTLDVLSCTKSNLYLRLAALFHDIGKPKCFSRDENGIGHFYNHHVFSAEIAGEVLKRLRYDNNTIEIVTNLVKEHMVQYDNYSDRAIKRIINRIGAENVDLLFDLKIADRKNKDIDEIIDIRKRCKEILNRKEPLSIRDLEINGNDLIELGIKPGKEIGTILNYLLDRVLMDPTLNKREVLLEIYCGQKKRT